MELRDERLDGRAELGGILEESRAGEGGVGLLHVHGPAELAGVVPLEEPADGGHLFLVWGLFFGGV